MSLLEGWIGKAALDQGRMDQTLLSSDSVKFLCSVVVNNPLSWWILIILALYIMEVFQLGTHSLPWNWGRRKEMKKMDFKTRRLKGLKGPFSNGISHRDECDGDAQAAIPDSFRKFVRSQVIPTFRMHCRNSDGRFSVLVFSHVSSLRDVGRTSFRQITFNGKPLVDSSQATYPEAYRYENYVVARSNGNEHPEGLIAKEVTALLAGFGRAERCYIRNPVPTFGLLYCSSLPCHACSKKIAESLSRVCRKRMVVAYSHEEGTKEQIRASIRCMVDAGISVTKIDKQ